MAKVDDWFWDFVRDVKDQIPRADWPPFEGEGSGYWDGFEKLLVRHGVTRAVADEALVALIESPPKHLDKFIGSFLNHVRIAWKANPPGSGGGAPNDVEAARNASRGCEHCHGDGFASVFHPEPDYARRVPASVAAHCVCPMGRFIRSRGLKKDPEFHRRVVDLNDVLAGRSAWRIDPPGSPPDFEAAEGFDFSRALKAIVAAGRVPGQAVRRDPAPPPLTPDEQAFAASLSPPDLDRFRKLRTHDARVEFMEFRREQPF